MKKNIFTSRFSQIFQAVSFWGVDKNASFYERNFTKLINQYLVLLFAIFFLQFAMVVTFEKFTLHSVFLGIISLFCLSVMALKEHRKNKKLLIFTFIFICLIITYYSSYGGEKSGVFLYYFPLVLGLAFFFDFQKDKKTILFLALFIISCFYLSLLYDFHLFHPSYLVDEPYQKKLMFMNVTLSFVAFVLDYYFIEEKKASVFLLQSKNENNIATIDHLKTENEKLLRKQILDNNLTKENVDEIMELVQKDDPFFLDKFQMMFPDLFPKLIAINSKLIISELNLCAMMRLNLDTKQIATYTNATIKSVESKKYRLRKKLDIPYDIEITQWILSI